MYFENQHSRMKYWNLKGQAICVEKSTYINVENHYETLAHFSQKTVGT